MSPPDPARLLARVGTRAAARGTDGVGQTDAMQGRAQAVIEDASRLLRATGGRMTVPRRAVIAALAEADDHVTAEELVTRVQGVSPDVHRSSVYRTLDLLTAAGVVRHVHVNPGGTAYHLADTGPHHLHAQCQVCGLVLDVRVDLLASARQELADTAGFRLDPGHVALSGTCANCAPTH